MGSSAKAQELRELLVLAVKLRAYAKSPGGVGDAALFLEVAGVLEARANSLAFGTPIQVPRTINFIC